MNDPRISVVIATNDARVEVTRCLDSLTQQTLRRGVEVIVADCSTDGTEHFISSTYPSVRLLHFSKPTSNQQLLKRALQQARGSIVAVTDTHCVFPRDWLEKLHRAHESQFAVIGGAVEHGGPDSLMSWASYFADYGAFMLPAPRQITSLLSGNHVSYKRSLVQEWLGSMQDGYWKVFFHWDLDRQGVRFLFDPELVVYCVPSERFWDFARQYYTNALHFGATRCKRISKPARILRIVTAPALPPLLLYRRLDAVWRKSRNRGKLLLSIPSLAVFTTAWSAGELAGYLSGPQSG